MNHREQLDVSEELRYFGLFFCTSYCSNRETIHGQTYVKLVRNLSGAFYYTAKEYFDPEVTTSYRHVQFPNPRLRPN